jgi:hypothetical protein
VCVVESTLVLLFIVELGRFSIDKIGNILKTAMAWRHATARGDRA